MLVRHRKTRQVTAIALVVLGGALMWLSPEDTAAGAALLAAGIALEIAGITLERTAREASPRERTP
jgi:hypothetical protein